MSMTYTTPTYFRYLFFSRLFVYLISRERCGWICAYTNSVTHSHMHHTYAIVFKLIVISMKICLYNNWLTDFIGSFGACVRLWCHVMGYYFQYTDVMAAIFSFLIFGSGPNAVGQEKKWSKAIRCFVCLCCWARIRSNSMLTQSSCLLISNGCLRAYALHEHIHHYHPRRKYRFLRPDQPHRSNRRLPPINKYWVRV